MLASSLRRALRGRALGGVRVLVDRQHLAAAAGQRQREAAVVREGVQRARRARAPAPRRAAWLSAWSRKPPVLPSLQEVGLQPVAPQAVDDARVAVARDDAREPRELLEVARRAVVAADDDARVEQLAHGGRDRRARGAHRHRRRLDDRRVGVAVDDQAGQDVALGVDDAIGVAVEVQRLAAGPAPRPGAPPPAPARSVGSGWPARATMRSARRGSRGPGGDAQRPAAAVDARAPATARRRWRRVLGPRTTSGRYTQGWPPAMRAAPRALTTAVSRSLIGGAS